MYIVKHIRLIMIRYKILKILEFEIIELIFLLYPA